jgi:hypothetical protein
MHTNSSAEECLVRSLFGYSQLLPLTYIVRVGRLIGKSFESEFGDLSVRIRQRTKTIDATAGALAQAREAQFIKGQSPPASDLILCLTLR